MNQLNRILTFGLFLFAIRQSNCQQNLIPNHSFEQVDSCAANLCYQLLYNWYSPTDGTPDLYNSCTEVFLNNSVPVNSVGFQYAQDGEAYVGMLVYSDGYDYREYIAAPLIESLKKDKLYTVEYHINLANISPFFSNNMGVAFARDSNYIPYTYPIRPTYQITDPRIIDDTLSWQKRTLFYQANGDERFVLFGNFEPDRATQAVRNNNPYNEQYFLIDNVSVTVFDQQIENVFTPNGDNINEIAFFYPNLTGVRCDILDRWGQLVKNVDTMIGWDGTDQLGNKLPEGTYFYQLMAVEQQLIIASGFIQLIE